MPGARPRSAGHQPRRGGREPDGQDHLPGHHAYAQALLGFRPGGRLFEVRQRVREANALRRSAPGRKLEGTSHFFSELQANPSLAMDFIIAPPRMAYYMAYSSRIYQIYLKYVAPEDIVVYSIDEVFMDATDYLSNIRAFRRTISP